MLSYDVLFFFLLVAQLPQSTASFPVMGESTPKGRDAKLYRIVVPRSSVHLSASKRARGDGYPMGSDPQLEEDKRRQPRPALVSEFRLRSMKKIFHGE